MEGNTMLEIIGAVVGSNALFAFVQYLISRHDTKHDKIKELDEKIDKGLEEREDTSKERYEEHQESIRKLNEAIMQLTENDTNIQKYIHYVGDELMGLAHDKLVHLTDKYQIRGGITLKEKATLEAIYVPYHDGLNGNGDGKTGYEYAMKLPVISDEKARELDAKHKYEEMKKIDVVNAKFLCSEEEN